MSLGRLFEHQGPSSESRPWPQGVISPTGTVPTTVSLVTSD